jgi:hypothetical protein
MKLMDNKLQKYDKDGECMRRQKKEPVVEGRERSVPLPTSLSN